MGTFHNWWSALSLLAPLIALSNNNAVVWADDILNADVTAGFMFAGEQLAFLSENVLVTSENFTDYSDEEGKWITIKDDGTPIDKTVWTSGMIAGMFWYQYEYTGDIIWKTRAEYISKGLEGVELLDDNDLGFQAFNSFGLGFRLTGNTSYEARALAAADSLYGFRYQANIPAFWSWNEPSQRPEWERAVNVDMMMNMEVMLWAARNSGNGSYLNAVEKHADTTWNDIVRDDDSTFHVADYDPDTGNLVDQGTYQGWKDNSTWSRGQAWAVYGFAMVHRFLGEDRFLDHSIDLLSYFVDNLPSDNVPYADFDAPINVNNSKDSSSTAIVGSALFELFELTGEPEYLEKAQEFLATLLSSAYLNEAQEEWEPILRRSSARWGDPEVGAVYADYFLLEAMVRYKTMAPSILLRDEGKVTILKSGSSGDLTVSFLSAALDNDVDISEVTTSPPVLMWFGVTLANADFVPTSVVFKTGSVSVEADIATPAGGGWKTGKNTVKFALETGSFAIGDWSTVEGISLLFSEGVQNNGGSSNDVVVNHLILGHHLKTSGAGHKSFSATGISTGGHRQLRARHIR